MVFENNSMFLITSATIDGGLFYISLSGISLGKNDLETCRHKVSCPTFKYYSKFRGRSCGTLLDISG